MYRNFVCYFDTLTYLTFCRVSLYFQCLYFSMSQPPSIYNIPIYTQFEKFTAHYDCTFNTELGKGGFGRVYPATCKSTQTPVAIKYVSMQKIRVWHKATTPHIPLEFYLVAQCQHIPGVIKVFGFVQTPTGWLLIMERFGDNTDLFTYVNNRQCLLEHEAVPILKQVVTILDKCHATGIVHGDLKSENILFDSSTKEIRLIDFGCGSVVQGNPITSFVGTGSNRTPEYLTKGSYNDIQGEIWSIGILQYDLLCGHLPYETLPEIIRNHLVFTQPLSTEAMFLIKTCLNTDPNSRPSCQSILQHKWFSKEHEDN